jgi:hypothetical protein
MSKKPFTKHEHDGIPLNSNAVPIPECKVVPVLQKGKVVKAVDVPMLGCASVWLRCQKEAEKWIEDCDGEIMYERPALINARINAAYAWLWLTDSRFQWAGLAAFASKQVGCGLLHFNELIVKADRKAGARSLIMGGLPSPNAAFDQMTAQSARYMKRQIAVGNRSLFLDIYPLHRFYTLRGFPRLKSCLDERALIREKVTWEVKDKLGFGTPFREILAGFEAIERGDIEESVKQLASHEQVNVLQKIIYDDPTTRVLLDANQAAWVTGFPSGLYQEVQLTLSAQCKPKRTLTTLLRKSMAVALWKPDNRMEFVYQAANDFAKLLGGKERADVERSLNAIYLGHGVT